MSILTTHKKSAQEDDQDRIHRIDERINNMRKQYNVAVSARLPAVARNHAAEIDRLLELRLERPWLGARR
jgi:hypothetical protein